MTEYFEGAQATQYDEKFAKLRPVHGAMHLGAKVILSELPPDARILCVGAGTGAELLALAEEFPRFEFTLVDPAADMLAICRARATAVGIEGRCTFVDGTTRDVAESEEFDAATSFLVSQFLVEPSARQQFFADLAARLKPGGLLLTADLVSDLNSDNHAPGLALWRRMFEFNGMSPEVVESMLAGLGKSVAVVSKATIEAMLKEAGFASATNYFHSFLIHAWVARRN